MLRIVALSAFGSAFGIAACCVGLAELNHLNALSALCAYFAGGSMGGICAAGFNALGEW